VLYWRKKRRAEMKWKRCPDDSRPRRLHVPGSSEAGASFASYLLEASSRCSRRKPLVDGTVSIHRRLGAGAALAS